MPYFALILVLTAFMAKPSILIALASFYHFIAFKCLVAIVLVKYRKNLLKLCNAIIKKIKPNRKSELVFGIEIHELVEYLVKFKSFRQVHVKNYFGIAHNKSVKLAKHLESRGILDRGKCNSFVLADLTRPQIVQALKEKANKINDFVIKKWNKPRIDFLLNKKPL
jgi:hypothetical protein